MHVPPSMGVNVRVQLTVPIGVVAAALHVSMSGARTPSFPRPRFQFDAVFAISAFCYLSRGKTWKVPASQSTTYVDARDASFLPLFNAVAANSTGVSPM